MVLHAGTSTNISKDQDTNPWFGFVLSPSHPIDSSDQCDEKSYQNRCQIHLNCVIKKRLISTIRMKETQSLISDSFCSFGRKVVEFNNSRGFALKAAAKYHPTTTRFIHDHVHIKSLSADSAVNALWNYGISITHNTFLQSQKIKYRF